MKTADTHLRAGKAPQFYRLFADISTREVVSVAHYTNRLLNHRRGITDLKRGIIVRGVAGEPSAKDAELAVEVIHRIERAEQAPIQSLDQRQADKYVGLLANVVRRRLRNDYGDDQARGRSLLAELRREIQPFASMTPTGQTKNGKH